MKMKMKKKGRILIENHPSPSLSESVTDGRLPQDLITEILLHLPVKYLVKFKCVSKPWRSLISSPLFIKSHFSTSLMDSQHFNHHLLFVDRNPTYGMKLCSLSAALHNPSTNVVSDIEFPSPILQEPLRIVGIVNGLVCLFVGRKDLYIWNPILKKSKLLPVSGSSVPLCSFVEHGFGYDESNDDYKVVQVLHLDTGGCVYQSNVNVYSLRRDSWRLIEGFMDGAPFRNGTYANGKMLWTAVRSFDSDEMWKIVSLDMASDEFEELRGPCYEFGAYNCGIGSFNGSISMICCETFGKKVDLWVMDKTGVEESWSRVFSLPCDYDFHPAGRQYFMEKVVCILGDGEIVLEGRWQLIVYCTKEKELRSIQLNGGGVYRDFSVYVESLVPV